MSVIALKYSARYFNKSRFARYCIETTVQTAEYIISGIHMSKTHFCRPQLDTLTKKHIQDFLWRYSPLRQTIPLTCKRSFVFLSPFRVLFTESLVAICVIIIDCVATSVTAISKSWHYVAIIVRYCLYRISGGFSLNFNLDNVLWNNLFILQKNWEITQIQ